MTKTIRNWSEYLDVIQSNSTATDVFRGEASDAFHLIPGVGRKRKFRDYNNTMERQLLENFRQKIALLVQTSQLDDWDTIAFAQHVGVPTRLLDWSLSPLVALFFALEGESECNRVVYIYKIKSFVDQSEKDKKPLLVKSVKTFIPKQFHPRIKAQRGVFTVHPDPKVEFQSESLQRIIIDKASVKKLRNNLFKMGIDYWHVYPDAEGIGRQLKWQFDHGVPATG